MCGGGGSSGPSAEETRLVEEQNRQAQENFDRSQGLAQDQFDFQKGQAGAAVERERQREARIKDAVLRINETFEKREPIFDQIESATFEANRDNLIEDRGNARRDLNFNSARAGLDGGSVDIDRRDKINERFTDGLQDSRSAAQSAANSARLTDSQIQANLVNTASTGNFSGSDLLNSARGALASSQNQSPVIVPNFANDTFFSDIVSGLGNVGAQLASGGFFNGGGRTSSGAGSSSGGTNFGNVRGG